MKKIARWVVLALAVPFVSYAQEQMINNFDQAPADTNYWAWFDNHGGQHYQTNEHADSAYGWIHVSYVNDPVQEGTGAMRLDYSVHNTESWGGYTKLEHWNPDSNAVYDWSAYDSIMIWYYNLTPQSLPGRVHFRFNLHDVSDSPNGAKTYDVQECEYWYSFHYILDDEPGWHRIAMPLVDGRYDPNLDEWAGEAFNRTGWAGIQGNDALDLDKIKGFSFEFSISGAGEGDYATGTLVIDHMALFSPRKVEIIFFNGRDVPSNVTLWGGWSGTGSVEITDEEASTPGTRSIKWNTPTADWAIGDGMGLFLATPKNLQASWQTDSLQFKIKAEPGLGKLEVVLFDPDEDGWGIGPDLEYNANYILEESAVGYDGTWKQVKIALKDFNRFAGGWNPATNQWQAGEMDCTKVAGLKINIMEASGLSKTVYLDDIWTGNPEIDVIAPEAPANVQAIASDYYNLVVWEDVPGEKDETYTVYASTQPITDVNDPHVDVIATKVPENTQAVTHWLFYPLEDREVTYYYAVRCKDAAGNEGELGLSSGPTTNIAKGLATISLTPPADFAADGDLSEWDASGIMPFVITPETHHVPVGDVTDADDLTGTVYLAIDDDYLYLAVDAIDDVYHYGEGNWWDQDAFQMFIGLYDQRGPTHTAIQRGEEPDYIIYCTEERLQLDYAGGRQLYTPEDENYFFTDLGGADYVIEAKIPLDSLVVQDDVRFHPLRGMRIPLDLYFHDNDGTWEGNLGLSPYSTDHQWQNPSEWLYTWIGDTTYVSSVEERGKEQVVTSYELSHNYPNPFNASTTITYALPKAGRVKIELFNTLGQKVRTLVDEYKPAGRYRLQFNGQELPSGIYFYRMEAGNFSDIKKMTLIK